MSRIYVIVSPPDSAVLDGANSALVRADSKAQALRYWAERTARAEVAQQETLVRLLSADVTVEDACGEQPELQGPGGGAAL